MLLGDSQLFLLLAIFIGLLAGLSVVLFRLSIEAVRIALLGSSLWPSWTRLVWVPAAVGLVTAGLVRWLFPQAKGSGVNQTKTAVYISDGYIPFPTVVGKFLVCSAAIGGGFSLGPEDPSLQMGAGIASALGRRLGLDREKTRWLAPVGAAAGLAAAFNAPISAVLFVIEEVIGTWSASGLGAIVLAAVAAVEVMRWFLGSEPIFAVPAVEPGPPIELLGYVALGVVGGVASLVFLRLLVWLHGKLTRLPSRFLLFLPALAGIGLGLLGKWVPESLGTGYVYADEILHGQYSGTAMALLAGAKILATTVCFAAGVPGGLFAPAMFVGTALGGAVGMAVKVLLASASNPVAAFGLVGVGTLFAGFLRVPITSVFMVVEISGNYSMVLPVMIANTLAYLVSRRYAARGLFSQLARQEGVELPSLEEFRERRILRVEQALGAADLPPVRDVSCSLQEAFAALDSAHSTCLLIHASCGDWALAERTQLITAQATVQAKQPVLAILPQLTRLPVLFPDQPLEDALPVVQRVPVVPVVSRADPDQLLGVLTLQAVLRTYRDVAVPPAPEQSAEAADAGAAAHPPG